MITYKPTSVKKARGHGSILISELCCIHLNRNCDLNGVLAFYHFVVFCAHVANLSSLEYLSHHTGILLQLEQMPVLEMFA